MQGITLVFVFAGIYRGHGLMDDGELVRNEVTALYFSIVTWTTLGYGDVTPPKDIRLVAALETIIGYIFLAVAAAIANEMRRDNETPTVP